MAHADIRKQKEAKGRDSISKSQTQKELSTQWHRQNKRDSAIDRAIGTQTTGFTLEGHRQHL